ncbi:hypothetical protein DM785_02410 [Deinococcus actinosclerus]|nr:hypothetical protein DM785_02410 [Deinococcus actinosclerus]
MLQKTQRPAAPLFPVRAPHTRREAGTFTALDNGAVAFLKRQGTVLSRCYAAIAERANYKRLPRLTVGGLIEALGGDVSARSVELAVRRLVTLGEIRREGSAYLLPKEVAKDPAKNLSVFPAENPVQGVFAKSLKEVEGSRRKLKTLPTLYWHVRFRAPLVSAGGTPVRKKDDVQPSREVQAPVGAAPVGASQEIRIDLTRFSPKGGDDVNANGAQKVPGGPAGPLAAAGLLDVWQDWLRSQPRLSPVARDLQLRQWVQWVGAGLAQPLREHATFVMTAGYGAPHAGLLKRMEGAVPPPAPRPTAPVDPDEVAVLSEERLCELDARFKIGSIWRDAKGHKIIAGGVNDDGSLIVQSVILPHGEFTRGADLPLEQALRLERVQ